jgi:hypothetical protein
MNGNEPGWVLDGFQATVALWGWTLWVLLHALFRLWHRPGPDPVRPAGPVAS